MASNKRELTLSIAAVFTAMFFVQTAIDSGSRHALGQPDPALEGAKHGQNEQYLPVAQGPSFQNSTRNIALATPQSSLTQIFKQVENSVVQITSRVSDSNMQI